MKSKGFFFIYSFILTCFSFSQLTASEIIYGCLWPEGHFGREVAQRLSERVSKETDHEITIKITPPMADEELTEKLIKGEIQMTAGHGIEKYVPEMGLTYLPYLYDSFEQFRAAWTLGSLTSDTIVRCAKEKLPAITILGYSIIGFRDIILRDTEISSIHDIENLRIRVDGSASSINTFNAFGAQPITIEYHKVKEAFHNKDIDAAENSPFNLIYMEWYKECKNVSLTKHLILLNVEMVNTEFWAKLTENQQKIIFAAMQDAVKEFSDIASKKRDEAIRELSYKYGLSVREISPTTREQLENKVVSMKSEFIKQHNLEKEYDCILSLGKK